MKTFSILLMLFSGCLPLLRAEDPPAIRALPKRIFPGMIHVLRLELPGPDPGKAAAGRYFSWTASAGELLSDGSREVHWKSPGASGKVVVSVEELASGASGKGEPRRLLQARAELQVESPSTAGMVFIPAGPFTMGDIWTDVADPAFIPTSQNMSDKPAHTVQLDGYWIDRNKTTNRQYAEFLDDARSQGLLRVTPEAALGIHEGAEIPFYCFKAFPTRTPSTRPLRLLNAIRWDGSRFRPREGAEDLPVMDVTWAGSRAFALHHGKRLPTEAEWEKAARGPDRRMFPWGNELPSRFHANINAYHGNEYVPVGSFSPIGDSPYGIADILGGFEWANDWFDAHYFRDNFSPDAAGSPPATASNPRGPEWGRDRTIRGMAVFTTVNGDVTGFQAPLSFRYQWVFEFEQGHLFAHGETGFRTALTLPEEPVKR